MDRAFGGGAGTFLAICARDVVSFWFPVVQGMARHSFWLPSSSVCFLLKFTASNSMIIKFLVCSPAFATLQLLFAGTQAHREGTAVSQSLSSSWSGWPNITTSRSRPSCGGDHFVLPGSATVDIRTPSVSDPSFFNQSNRPVAQRVEILKFVP